MTSQAQLLLACALFAFTALRAEAATAAVAPAALTGHWEGALGVEGSVQIMRLDVPAGGGTPTYDIPELGLFGESVKLFEPAVPDVRVGILYGSFLLHLSGDDLTGLREAKSGRLTLHLKRMAGTRRYDTVDLNLRGPAGSIAGRLYVPHGRGPYPLVVVVPGSGEQGLATWEYRGNADIIAQHGAVAFVYDKRGVGRSAGNLDTVTIAEQADDVRAIVRQLRRRADVEPQKVALMGISQGGWIAPLAADANPDVSDLILIVGPAVSLERQERERVEDEARAAKLSTEDQTHVATFTDLLFATAYGLRPQADLDGAVMQAKASKWGSIVAIPSGPQDVAWWRSSAYDPKTVLSRVRVPVLALYAENDREVRADENAALLRQYAARAGERDITIVTVPGVGHALYTGESLVGTGTDWPARFYRWDRRVALYEQTLADWLRTHLGAD
jgi:uncharacterized protein